MSQVLHHGIVRHDFIYAENRRADKYRGKSGGSVVVTAAPDPQPAPAAPAAVDVVTSATLAKKRYFPPMPVMFPPQPKKD